MALKVWHSWDGDMGIRQVSISMSKQGDEEMRHDWDIDGLGILGLLMRTDYSDDIGAKCGIPGLNRFRVEANVSFLAMGWDGMEWDFTKDEFNLGSSETSTAFRGVWDGYDMLSCSQRIFRVLPVELLCVP